MKKLLTLLFSLSWLILQADPGGKLYKQGKELYDKGNYREAMPLFNQAITENPERYNSKGNYMIGLCYKKLDACSQALPYFKKAYQSDAQNGGASSLDKFKEQVSYCRSSLQALANVPDPPENNTSSYIQPENPPQQTTPPVTVQPTVRPEKKHEGSTGLILGVLTVVGLAGVGGGGFLVYRQIQKNKQLASDNKQYHSDQLYNIQEMLFDDMTWQKYSEQYGNAPVSNIRNSWQLEYAQLVESKDEVGINQLLRKIRQLETSPQTVFGA
jgi:tetratricopeptide (TPR) repeat protein